MFYKSSDITEFHEHRAEGTCSLWYRDLNCNRCLQIYLWKKLWHRFVWHSFFILLSFAIGIFEFEYMYWRGKGLSNCLLVLHFFYKETRVADLPRPVGGLTPTWGKFAYVRVGHFKAVRTKSFHANRNIVCTQFSATYFPWFQIKNQSSTSSNSQVILPKAQK